MTFKSPIPKGFVPAQNVDGARTVVLPAEDGKRVNVVWAHTGPLVAKIEKNGFVELGPRHKVSLAAWKGTMVPKPEKAAIKKAPAKKAAKKAVAAEKPAAAATDDENRPRGRPRNDGLMPGSEAVGILKHAHETRTVVPQEVLDLMTPETRLIEEARNDRLNAGSPRRGRPPKTKSNVVDINRAKKAAKKAVAAEKPARRLLRRTSAK